MLLLSTLDRFLPNYKCGIQRNLMAVIGGLDTHISLHIATILDIYKIPQIIYGPSPVMTSKTPKLPFYQMFPKESLQYEGILSLLLHFQWTWIGVLVKDEDDGERFMRTVLPEFSENGICFAFIERNPKFTFVSEYVDMMKQGAKIHDKVMDSTAYVVVVHGDSFSMIFLKWMPFLSEQEHVVNKRKGKVWILTAQVEYISYVYQRDWNMDTFHGTISFMMHSNALPGFKPFVESRNPSSSTEDGFIKDFWQQAFGCDIPNPILGNVEGDVCTGEERLENLPGSLFEMRMTGNSYSLYNAVYAVAHALHAVTSAHFEHRVTVDRGEPELQNQQLWQV
ncbi:vomeronasal type-2 receptor 26-like [Tiliqua scincoides]|uniref:vomeronasal type-2 receptor 26-like n=1 Tax=Tiliqua scincoides TaxID=71010 RepID=UPI00346229F3